MVKTMLSLEMKIDVMRQKLYQAYENNVSYEELLELSVRLDHLLNKFQQISNQSNIALEPAN